MRSDLRLPPRWGIALLVIASHWPFRDWTHVMNQKLFQFAGMFLILMGAMGCKSVFSVHPPEYSRSSLAMPGPNSPRGFMIDTVDQIDRSQPIGHVGSTFWGGQYRVMLTGSLQDYFEAETAQSLQSVGILDQDSEAIFNDWTNTLVDEVDLYRIRIDTDDIVTSLSQTGG